MHIRYRLLKSEDWQSVLNAVDDLWSQLQDQHSDAYKAAVKSGVRVDLLPKGVRDNSINISADGAGLDPWVVDFLVSFGGGVAASAVCGCWKMFILPYVETVFGRKVFQELRQDEESS